MQHTVQCGAVQVNAPPVCNSFVTDIIPSIFSIFNRIHKLYAAVHASPSSSHHSIESHSFIFNVGVFLLLPFLFFFFFPLVCGIKTKLNFNLLNARVSLCVCVDFCSNRVDCVCVCLCIFMNSMQFNVFFECFAVLFMLLKIVASTHDAFEKWHFSNTFEIVRMHDRCININFNKILCRIYAVDDMHQNIQYKLNVRVFS